MAAANVVIGVLEDGVTLFHHHARIPSLTSKAKQASVSTSTKRLCAASGKLYTKL